MAPDFLQYSIHPTAVFVAENTFLSYIVVYILILNVKISLLFKETLVNENAPKFSHEDILI